MFEEIYCYFVNEFVVIFIGSLLMNMVLMIYNMDVWYFDG